MLILFVIILFCFDLIWNLHPSLDILLLQHLKFTFLFSGILCIPKARSCYGEYE